MTEKTTKILAFAGSTRIESYNKKLARIALNLCSDAGFNTTYIDLKFYPLPLYDGDLEEEVICPEHAEKLRNILIDHDAFIIASPEYNSSISGVLKNMIDWCSRPRIDEASLMCFKNKVVGLLSASPGSLGGIRGLAHVRNILGNLGCIMTPTQLCVAAAHDKISKDGYLINDNDQEQMQVFVDEFLNIVRKQKA